MKGSTDIVQSIYVHLLTQKKYQQGFPKDSQEYRKLRQCDPSLFDKYINVLKDTAMEVELKLNKENLPPITRASFESFNLLISKLIATHDRVEQANKNWSEAYMAEKGEDSTACETKQSSEEASIVKIVNPSQNDYIYFGEALHEEYIVVQEEYNDPVPLNTGW